MLANIVQDGGGWLSVLLGTGIGLVFGVFMGFLVSMCVCPPSWSPTAPRPSAAASRLIVSGGIAQNTMFVQFKKLGSGSVWLPADAAIFAAVILIFMVRPHDKTKYGRSLYAMGSNERVAGLCGLPTRKYKMIAFTVAGACTGLAGVLMSARLGAGTHSQGQAWSLDAIAAVVMGGTSLSGGKGSVTRTITGVFVILMLNNGQNLMGVSPHVQILVKGIVVILAVAASSDWKSKDIVK